MSTAPSLVIAAWRMIIAATLMVPFAIARRGRIATNPRVPNGGSQGRTVLLLVGSGVFLAAHFATWVSSLAYTSVVHSTVLVTMHPILVILGSVLFLKKRVPPIRIALTIVALVGAVVLASGGSVRGIAPTLKGDLLAFLGAVAIAGYLVIGSWARSGLSATLYNAVVHTVAAGVLVALALGTGRSLTGYSLREWIIFAALALFCTILGHALLNWALRYVSAIDVSAAILLEPVFASVIAALLFDEIPGYRTIIGAAIVLSSIAAMRATRRTPPSLQS
jgi:drug/metabolite transporter (DMT)-like permease